MTLNLCSSLILASLAVLQVFSDYDQLNGTKFSSRVLRCTENKLKNIYHHHAVTNNSKFIAFFWKIYNGISNLRWYRVLDITTEWLEDLANEHREKDNILDEEDEDDFLLTIVDLEFNDLIMSYIYMAKVIKVGKKKEILASIDEIQNVEEVCDNINCDLEKLGISKFRISVPEVWFCYENKNVPLKMYKSHVKRRISAGYFPTMFGLQVDQKIIINNILFMLEI